MCKNALARGYLLFIVIFSDNDYDTSVTLLAVFLVRQNVARLALEHLSLIHI